MSFRKTKIADLFQLIDGDDLIDYQNQIWEVVEVLPLLDEASLQRKFGKREKIVICGAQLSHYYLLQSNSTSNIDVEVEKISEVS